VTAFVVKMACWSNSDIKEQLGLCIPQEAIPGEIHVFIEVKLLHWFVVLWSRATRQTQSYTIVLEDNSHDIYHDIYHVI
jgi:hypothetical protein